MIAERALRTLEYDKVREQVAKFCTSSLGKSAIEQLIPETDFETVVELLEEMDEGLSILRVKGNVPMGGIFDVRPQSKRAQIGGMLSPMELMEIASTIRASRILRNFMEDIEQEGDIIIPHFIERKEQMPILTALQHEINDCIDDNGAVLDCFAFDSTIASGRGSKGTSKIRELNSWIQCHENAFGCDRNHSK